MPISALSHLIPAARKVAELVDAQRISAIQRDRWVNYPRATEALERLERLLQTPKRERMPCTVMHGDSNIGKTLIIAKFMRGHPPSFDATRAAEQRDIIAMQMPATPDQHRFYSALLYELNAPFGARASVSALERLARGLLKQLASRAGGLCPRVRGRCPSSLGRSPRSRSAAGLDGWLVSIEWTSTSWQSTSAWTLGSTQVP